MRKKRLYEKKKMEKIEINRYNVKNSLEKVGVLKLILSNRQEY